MKSDCNNHELPIPDAVNESKHARELIRVWAAGGSQHISIAAELWKDPATWGIALVDLAKLVADSYHETTDIDRSTALASIKRGLDAEWNTPTDEPAGSISCKKPS